MIVIVGASASGKTEIAKILVSNFNYYKCITTTTRPPREGEKDGVSYHFLTKLEFNELIINHAFVEIITYQDHFYGTQKKDLKENSVIILEPNGANAIVEYLKHKAFVVLVDSNKKLRKDRMIIRGDQPKEIRKRLRKDDKLFNKKNLLKVDLHIKNKNEPLEELASIVYETYLKYKAKNTA